MKLKTTTKNTEIISKFLMDFPRQVKNVTKLFTLRFNVWSTIQYFVCIQFKMFLQRIASTYVSKSFFFFHFSNLPFQPHVILSVH